MLDATGPDLLRLLAIPFFAYVAWLDIRTRRVPNRTWLPLLGLAVLVLAWDLLRVATGSADSVFLVQAAISVGFVVPLAYLFWRVGGFGGADAKAFFLVAILFPAYPSYRLGTETLPWLFEAFPGATYVGFLPLVQTDIGVFSITVLSNTVILGALYPVALAARNLTVGYISPGMFVAKPVSWDRATEEYGTLLAMPDGDAGLAAYLSFRGVDLDALRMYLRWRGLSLSQLRENPQRYRNPASLPPEANHPGDGAIPVGGWKTGESADEPTTAPADGPDTTTGATAFADAKPWGPESHLRTSGPDPWGAAAFLDDIEGSAYGTSPEALREGLETLADDDVVWISPGIPFLVPLFLGLVVAVVYGDVLFALFQTIGLGA